MGTNGKYIFFFGLNLLKLNNITSSLLLKMMQQCLKKLFTFYQIKNIWMKYTARLWASDYVKRLVDFTDSEVTQCNIIL
jgi:hypothetical protein